MKKMHLIYKSRVFFRYMISYLGVLVLALVLTGLFLYTYFLGQYQKQVVANISLQLEQTKTVLDGQITKINTLSQQIFVNLDVKMPDLALDPRQGMKAQSELKKYAISENLLYDVFFYPGKNEWLISPNTSIEIDRFISRYPLLGQTQDEFLATLADVKGFRVYPATPLDKQVEKDDTSLITFVYSDMDYTTQRRRNLLFFLNETELRGMLPSDLGVLGHILIYDNNGQVISSSLPQQVSAQLYAQLPNDNNQGHSPVKLNNEDFLCMVRRSADTQWTYLSLVSPKVAFASIHQLKLFIFLCFAGILIVGFWLCFICATRSYAPLGELKQFADGEANNTNPKDMAHNEFESVRNALSALRTSNITLTHEVERSGDAVREQLLYYLIKGEITTTAEFNERGKFVQLQLPSPWGNFAVAVFYAAYSAEIHFSELSRYGRSVENILPANMIGFARAYNEPSRLTLTLCCEQNDTKALVEAVSQCREHLAYATNVPVAVGISSICHAVADFPRAYIQAQTALEYRFLRGEHSVLPFGETASTELKPDVELRNIPEKIDNIFRKGNFEELNNFLTNITAYLRESNIPLFSAKMICYDIINAISKNVGEQYYKFLTKGFERPNVFSISSFETVDELLEVLIETNTNLSCLLTDKDETALPSMLESMILYIRTHCYDCNFSINRMAEQFNMSSSNLSQYFKSKTNDTIINFITQVKLSKAKELLLNTSMPLQDIATEVGYYNVTSFIRRFKQQCGQTPGGFRRNI